MRGSCAALLLLALLWTPVPAQAGPSSGAPAPVPPPFPAPPEPPPQQRAHLGAALWSDGADLLALRRGAHVSLLRRGRPLETHTLAPFAGVLRGYVASRGVAGSGAGDGAAVLLWDGEGHLEWLAQGRWRRAQAEVSGDDSLIGAVDGAGRAYAAAGDRIQIFDGDEARSRYLPMRGPAPAERVRALHPSGAGLLILTSGRRLLRLRGEALDEVPLPVLPEALRRHVLWESAYSEPSDTLWVLLRELDGARAQHLVGLHLAEGRAELHPLRAAGAWDGAERLRVARRGGRDLLALCAGRDVQIFDGARLTPLRDWDGPFPSSAVERPDTPEADMTLVSRPGDVAVYQLERGRLVRHPLEEPAAHAAAEARRRSRPFALPSLRVGLGPLWHLAPEASAAALALDVGAGAAVYFGKGKKLMTLLLPELVYSYDRTERLGGHALSLGMGVAVGNLYVMGGYTPRLVIPVSGERGVGLRHGASLHVLASSLIAELSHEVLWQGGEAQHDLRLLFSINVAPIIAGIVVTAALASIFR